MNPTKLDLPNRTTKPRTSGRTHILDKGSGVRQVGDQLDIAGDYVDLCKLGWGTSVVTRNLREKIDLYHANNIELCFGGTLFELFYLQGKLDDYIAWMKDVGVRVVEVSDGTLDMEHKQKLSVIERLGADFEVHSEVGSKDSTAIVTPARWVAAIQAELSAGAKYVILEGRESGTAGLYRPSGEIRMGLVDEILDEGIAPDHLIFEAPKKVQQVWLIRHVGPQVNLANIPLSEVIAVETLRLGLRADTLLHLHGPSEN